MFDNTQRPFKTANKRKLHFLRLISKRNWNQLLSVRFTSCIICGNQQMFQFPTHYGSGVLSPTAVWEGCCDALWVRCLLGKQDMSGCQVQTNYRTHAITWFLPCWAVILVEGMIESDQEVVVDAKFWFETLSRWVHFSMNIYLWLNSLQELLTVDSSMVAIPTFLWK